MSINEVQFCSDVATWITQLCGDKERGHVYPFETAFVEAPTAGQKRRDLTITARSKGKQAPKPVLTGEVKLPDNREGRSAYAMSLVTDAHTKAQLIGVRWFFTWNINEFVLWDAQDYAKPLLERRAKSWTVEPRIPSNAALERPEVQHHLRTVFLPKVLAEAGKIVTGAVTDWGMAPDEFFIKSMESFLEPPILRLKDFLGRLAGKGKRQEAALQRWFELNNFTYSKANAEDWSRTLELAARTMSYVLLNRLIFYKALRQRFKTLPDLSLPARITEPKQAFQHLDSLFERAIKASGDYETLFRPEKDDETAAWPLADAEALDAWRVVTDALQNDYSFEKIPSDIIGHIFQRLIGADERRRYGQHFTEEDPVDLINAFCIRNASDTVFDPACGSGSFLVGAYYRKRFLSGKETHERALTEIYGCDIARYPAHLAIMNLAAREIKDERNYPRIGCSDFFDLWVGKELCKLPGLEDGRPESVLIPQFDAVVGNPPYVRQEKVERKDHYAARAAESAPDLQLRGRSDLHLYFWPVAAAMLKPEGWFGFLTSSSWLDADYGFPLQAWLLHNFRVVAIMESAVEPWFTDARVKTAITILQRRPANGNGSKGMDGDNVVRFVRLKVPLRRLLSEGRESDRESRIEAAEDLRDRILAIDEREYEDDDFRIVSRSQSELFWEGTTARSALMWGSPPQASASDDGEDSEEDDDVTPTSLAIPKGGYVAGKWGRYLRAPSLYFELLGDFGGRFTRFGQIAEIRFGVKTGCDAFFLPLDITKEALESTDSASAFKATFGASRTEVANGDVKIIRSGDGTEWPIEAAYVKPELHSLRDADRPRILSSDLDRVILLVGEDMAKLKGTYVLKYLQYGSTATFASTKSKAVPVPERPSCAAREKWYDLTALVKPGIAFWPKASQYRHVIPENTDRLICNCNVYDIFAVELLQRERRALVPLLNSTLVALFKTYYGRFAGTEGNLKTEVVDVKLMEIPNPKGISAELAAKLKAAFDSMKKRPVGSFVHSAIMKAKDANTATELARLSSLLPEELLQQDRRDLDDAVFELIGVKSAKKRKELIDRLYKEVADYFREVRLVEIIKQRQRTQSGPRGLTDTDIIEDVWDHVDVGERQTVRDWLGALEGSLVTELPNEGEPKLAPKNDPFNATTVVFSGTTRSGSKGKREPVAVDLPNRPAAELTFELAKLGLRGELALPDSAKACTSALTELRSKLEKVGAAIENLVAERTQDTKRQKAIVASLMGRIVG